MFTEAPPATIEAPAAPASPVVQEPMIAQFRLQPEPPPGPVTSSVDSMTPQQQEDRFNRMMDGGSASESEIPPFRVEQSSAPSGSAVAEVQLQPTAESTSSEMATLREQYAALASRLEHIESPTAKNAMDAVVRASTAGITKLVERSGVVTTYLGVKAEVVGKVQSLVERARDFRSRIELGFIALEAIQKGGARLKDEIKSGKFDTLLGLEKSDAKRQATPEVSVAVGAGAETPVVAEAAVETPAAEVAASVVPEIKPSQETAPLSKTEISTAASVREAFTMLEDGEKGRGFISQVESWRAFAKDNPGVSPKFLETAVQAKVGGNEALAKSIMTLLDKPTVMGKLRELMALNVPTEAADLAIAGLLEESETVRESTGAESEGGGDDDEAEANSEFKFEEYQPRMETTINTTFSPQEHAGQMFTEYSRLASLAETGQALTSKDLDKGNGFEYNGNTGDALSVQVARDEMMRQYTISSLMSGAILEAGGNRLDNVAAFFSRPEVRKQVGDVQINAGDITAFDQGKTRMIVNNRPDYQGKVKTTISFERIPETDQRSEPAMKSVSNVS